MANLKIRQFKNCRNGLVMALDTSILVDAMLGNIVGTPSADQVTAANALANAIKAFVEGAEINYVSGLSNSGGDVIGVFDGALV